MNISKPLPQGKSSSRPWTPPTMNSSPFIAARSSSSDSASNLPSSVKYAEWTVAVPVDADFEEDSFVNSFHPQLLSTTPTNKKKLGGVYHTDSSVSSRTSSPYAFIPIEEGRPTRFVSPCPSPHDNRKIFPSPSMMSMVTDSTTETVGTTLDSRISPLTLASMSPPMFRPKVRGRESPLSRASMTGPKLLSSGRKSPFSKANEDELARKTRVKTELCMHYENGRPCPFGANCTYAHGEEELQMTKLLDLETAGLVEVETYRTKPCFAWVMTGSCPFGKRCTCIHDPRVEGTSPSWLPHTETQGNSTATDINVDALHQKRCNEIHNCTPFGLSFSLKNKSFDNIYNLICNIKPAKDVGSWSPKSKRVVEPIFALQIALKMLGDADWTYKYRPQHVIHDELCMVLQDRAFTVAENYDVVEIPMEDYNPLSPSCVRVTELAFGPDSEPTVRGVSLYFNIGEGAIAMCTPQQAKRFRWKRSLKKGENEAPKPLSKFDSLDHFEMVRPHDMTAFDIVKTSLAHRLAVLKAERIPDTFVRDEELSMLEEDKKHLRQHFQDIKKHWKAWAWPVNFGREKVDENTPVPAVEGEYEFAPSSPDPLGSCARPIWNSFVKPRSEEIDKLAQYSDVSSVNKSGKRLPVFYKLSMEQPIDLDRSLPMISETLPSKAYPVHGDEYERQKEHCWRALLLNGLETNEWEAVQEHFDKSRSKKVLGILQQKTCPSPVQG